MKVTGIICEYNPLHSGHIHQLRVARESGADCIIALMSGSFTQRGEPAVFGKYHRAEAALLGGADLVVELPYPFSASSAEFFASAGVSILTRLGATHLCFGSESGDKDLLLRAAEIALSHEFRQGYSESVKDSVGSAAAYFNRLASLVGVKDFSSNDVLGVEYCKAILAQSSPMIPEVIRRIGAGYREEELTGDLHPSASAVRRCLYDTDSSLLAGAYRDAARVSPEIAELIRTASERGEVPADMRRALPALLGFFRLKKPSEISHLAELSGGMAERICAAARESTSYDEFYRLASTKKYTDSHVRRAILFAMTGVTPSDLRMTAPYVNLLAANARGREYLSSRRRAEETIKIVTRPASILQDREISPEFARQVELQQDAEALYTLCLPTPLPAGIYLKSRAVML